MPEQLADRARIEELAHRVRWLDQHRRKLAIAIALVVTPFVIWQFAEAVGSDWPDVHIKALSIVVGVVAWLVFEVGLAGLTAMWETKADRLIRLRGLPRAELLRPRRK